MIQSRTLASSGLSRLDCRLLVSIVSISPLLTSYWPIDAGRIRNNSSLKIKRKQAKNMPEFY